MYNDEFELTFDLADAGPKKEQRRPTLPEPEEAAVAAPPVQETREMPVSAAPENTPPPAREPKLAAEPRSTAPAAKDRTVLISGGDRGIGAAAARAFYAAGYRVAVFYHTNAEAAAALQKELPGVLAVQCVVASRASCELAFRAAKAAAALGHEFLKNLAADNAASGAQNVEAVPGASASGSPESLPDAKGNVPKTQAERMAAAEAVVAELLDDDKK